MFPGCLCFRFIKIFQENFVVFNKIRGVLAIVHKLWSSTHQLKKIPVIITSLPFYFAQAI